MLNDGFEEHRGNCEVMCGALGILELVAKRGERCRVLIVAVDVAQQADQLFESGGIQPAVFLQAVFRASAELIKAPSGFGYADYRNVEVSSLHHRLQRWKNLLVGEIACGAEENQRVGMQTCHENLL